MCTGSNNISQIEFLVKPYCCAKTSFLVLQFRFAQLTETSTVLQSSGCQTVSHQGTLGTQSFAFLFFIQIECMKPMIEIVIYFVIMLLMDGIIVNLYYVPSPQGPLWVHGVHLENPALKHIPMCKVMNSAATAFFPKV